MTIIEKIVIGSMAACFVGALALGGVALHAASRLDTSGGLKPMLEEAWRGKPGCTEQRP